MPSVTARTKKVGGSLMVTLPKPVVDLLDLKEDELVELVVQRPRKSYLGVLRGIGPFSESDRAEHE